MRYASNRAKAVKNAALAGLAGLVITLASGCSTAASRGCTVKVLEIEYGAKTTRSKEAEIQKQVIDADAKYKDTVNVVPGKGFGLRYKEE